MKYVFCFSLQHLFETSFTPIAELSRIKLHENLSASSQVLHADTQERRDQNYKCVFTSFCEHAKNI